MLSSITPLGQRGRGASWTRTVVAFWLAATIAGGLVFGLLGLVGFWLGLPVLNPWLSIGALIVAGVLDTIGLTPPGPHRQVDENWLGAYRDWVVGIGFGAQLGAGFATIVPSFGTWALLVVALGAGVPTSIGLGVAFGVGRSLLLVTTRSIGSPSALAENMRRFAVAEDWARWLSLAGYVAALALAGIHVA